MKNINHNLISAMKGKVILLFIILLNYNSVKCQSYISYKYTEILKISIKYTFTGNTYNCYKPYYSTAYILNAMQERYDRNYNIISVEWGKVKELELVNYYNKQDLQSHKNDVDYNLTNAKPNVGDQNSADNIIYNITKIYNVPSIKDEIKLLRSCYTELERIKYEDPDNYIYSKRYKSINLCLENLANCLPQEIRYLSWESIELDEKYNNSSGGSTTNYNTQTSSTQEQFGTMGFYAVSSIGYIDVYVDDYFYGTLTLYLTTGNATCGDPGVLSVKMPVGNHYYKCICGRLSWSGTSYVKPGVCNTISLTK